jgi:transmembrane sensor
MKDIDKRYFGQILKRYRKGGATPQEIRLLESFYDMFDVNDDLIGDDNEAEFAELKIQLKNAVDNQIDQSIRVEKKFKYRKLVTRLSAAAAILIFIAAGMLLFNQQAERNKARLQVKNRIEPGGNRATLLLANGTKIDLNHTNNGVISRQAGITINKNAEGLLVYTIDASKQPIDQSGTIGQNTVSTPKGGQYQIILPDGTHATLNAASSLSYPVAFTGSERLVELTGEAYFEVAKDKAHPFKVKSGSQTVTVLGTHFNINAYADEAAIKTTLLEGSVEVSTTGGKEQIVPGQQAIWSQTGQIIKRSVDVDKEVAWKNGLFSFDGDDLKSILRQIGRWYNVDVSYSGAFPDEKFYGEITRSSKLADVLRIMEINNIHFEIVERHLTVSYHAGK